MQVEELPFCQFGSLQTETFAPLIPTIETFAEEHGMKMERSFDKDPLRPEACYFLVWSHPVCSGCFIRICASDPFHFVTEFRIGTSGWKQPLWDYDILEGPEHLLSILAQAKPQAEQCRKTQQPAT
jgi:hypothetical protein